jgi:predicted ABC-type ATPase
MIQPSLVMIAGPNGSGKSTLIRKLQSDSKIILPSLYINADDLKIQHQLTDAAAQSLAEQLRKNAMSQRESVMFETVASHPSKISELQQARLAGYQCNVILIATDNPNINVDRVAHRVNSGGHNVPENKIRERYQRTLALFPSMIEQCTEVLIFDNTFSNSTRISHTLQALLAQDNLLPQVTNPAHWVQDLISKVAVRAQERQAIFQTNNIEISEAILEDGQYQGAISLVSTQYAIQDAQPQFVSHDLNLLPPHLILEQGRNYSISYRQGVMQVS